MKGQIIKKNIFNFILFISLFGILNNVYSATNSWDLSIPGDYTISDSNKINLHNDQAKLKSTLTSVGRLNNGPVILEGATNVEISGNYAYVSSYGSNAIEIIDISVPTLPVHISNIAMNNTNKLYGPYDLAISGNYLYVASYTDDDIEVIDISIPASPTHVINIANNASRKLNGPRGLDISGNYLYVASYIDDALQIIDITIPTAPVSKGFLKNVRLNGAMSVKIKGNYAYIANYIADSMEVIDISNPNTPVFAGQLLDNIGGSRLNGAWGIDIDGNQAYIGSYTDDTLEIIDISIPTAPVHLSHVRNSLPGTELDGPRYVKIDGNFVYVGSFSDDALQIIDISIPSVPVVKGFLKNINRLNGASGVFINGNDAYMTSNIGGSLQVIDVTNKNSPSFKGEIISGPVKIGGATNIITDGNYAYISAYLSHSVEIIDISDKTNPTHASVISGSNTTRLMGVYDLQKVGNYLYTANYWDDAMTIIDVSDPLNPVQASTIRRATNTATHKLNGARGIHVSGNYAYVASYVDDAMQIIDITNPLVPIIKGFVKNSVRLNGAVDVKVKGNYAYVTSYSNDKIQVIDISDKDIPIFVNEIVNSAAIEEDGGWGIEIEGNYMYVSAFADDGVQVYDITDPINPVPVSKITNGAPTKLDAARNSVLDEGYMYVAAVNNDAVQILDISDTGSISAINYYSDSLNMNGINGISKQGNHIFTANYLQNSLEILKESYFSDSPNIIPNIGFFYTGEVNSISETSGDYNSGSTTYQISKDDGVTWYYYNGTNWITTISGTAESNTIADINTNIAGFNAIIGGVNTFKWKGFLNSNGEQKVELNTLNITTIIPSPAPGGITSGLQIWIKADEGTSTTTDGANLSTWDDQSGNGFNANGGVSPIYRNNSSDNLNYNPVIDFNGSTQYLENLANGAYSHSYYAVIIPDSTVDASLTGQVPFGFDCNSGVLNTGTCGLTFAGLTLGSFTIAIADEVITHALGSGTKWRSAVTGTDSFDGGKPMLINMNEKSSGNGTEISEKGELLNNFEVNTYQNLSTANYTLGRSPDLTYPFYYDGKIAEIIDYNSRTSVSDKKRIESYLSIKYGMTLLDGTTDYIASDGTTIFWSNSTAGIFTNDVFGIARDDISKLSQIKSKSINKDNIITIEAIGEGTNLTPSFTDISDLEFLTISNNDGSTSWSATDSPAGYNILSRQWKVQETGEIGTVDLDFDVANTDFNVPATSSGTIYYYIYDSNNNNSLNDETPVAMINTTGNIWQISGIDLNHDREFTIATQASSNNIPTNITLSNNSINENVASGTTIGTFSTADADLLDTHTYSFVVGTGDDNNSNFSISGNTLTISLSPDYEMKSNYTIRVETNDGNGGTFQKIFIININDLPETINTIIDFEELTDEDQYTVTSGTWTRTTTNPNEGTYSNESDNGGLNNTQSCFETNNTFSGTGTINFDYEVSSQAGDYLGFYINNIEQETWSGAVSWATYTKTDITSGTHTYKWCYVKDTGGSALGDNAFIDYITFSNSTLDIIPPDITSINYLSGTLLPGGNHNIIINYNDPDSGIDITSDNIILNKWNGTIWGTDISATGFDLGSKVITTTGATYPTSNLVFGKYRYNFDISDIAGNTSNTGTVFYIDEPEIIVSSGAIDIGNINNGTTKFSSGALNITVKTVGAGFDVILNKDTGLLLNGTGTVEIIDWNGTNGVGFDKNPYTSTINVINTNQIIATQSGSINIDGNKNIYIYSVKFGAKILEGQTAGDYESKIRFGIDMDY